MLNSGAGVRDHDIGAADLSRNTLRCFGNIYGGCVAVPCDGDRIDNSDAVNCGSGVVVAAYRQGRTGRRVGERGRIADGIAGALTCVPDAYPLCIGSSCRYCQQECKQYLFHGLLVQDFNGSVSEFGNIESTRQSVETHFMAPVVGRHLANQLPAGVEQQEQSIALCYNTSVLDA